MIEFWIICALLLAVALLFVVWPLWRGAAKSNSVARNAANLEIFRDQLAELDVDLANGLLTPELYEQGKRELQARLLDEVNPSAEKDRAQPRNPLKALALALALLIPLATVGLYLKLGNQDAFLEQSGFLLSGAALQELEEKLAKKPENPQGWLLLARSYVELGKYGDAVRAYDKLTRLVPNEAQLWADYADALAVAQGQAAHSDEPILRGEPTELLNKALEVDPNHPKTLALAGSAAMERGDFPAAIKYWENLLQQMPDKNSELAAQVAAGVQMARSYLAQTKGGKAPMTAQAPTGGQAKRVAPGTERITGTVTLSDAVKAKAAPDDTLFVLARAVDGPPMPVAVVRRQVKDLPLQFALDDGAAVVSQLKLSGFDRVVVIARVSKSGNAMPQAGDLQGVSAVVKPGVTGLKINIDSVVK